MPKIITNEDAQYAFDIVKRICTEVGPGLPGTPQERARAAILKDELESHLGAENVAVEEFTLAPGAIFGTQPMSALFTLLAALLIISSGRFTGISPWLTALLALVLSAIPLLLFVFEFYLGYELVDPLLEKKQSVNVIGSLRRPGAQSVKRLLILSGHHDSAFEFTWLGVFRKAYFIPYVTMFLGMIVVLLMSILQLAGLIAGNAGAVQFGTLGWVLMAYPVMPSVILTMFFVRGKKNGGTVPGAADNLSASALAVAMCRFLVKNPDLIPDDTEIRFISFGCEEAGVRGSRRYVARHLDELKRLDTRLLNYETVAHPLIAIITSDQNGTLKYSPEMVKSVVAAAERAGVPYKLSPGFLGAGSDAGPFTKAGLKSATLLPFKVPEQYAAFYHQKWDTPDILTIEPLLNVLKLTLEWIRCGGM